MKFLLLALLTILLYTSCSKTTGENFDIRSLPSEWVKLTETDSGLVIYNSCDQGNLMVSITHQNNMTGLFMHGMLEDYFLRVVGAVLVDDTIKIKAKWPDSGESEELKFVWIDKDKELSMLISQADNGQSSQVILVSQDEQSNFRIVNQPCRECWGDDCDEMEKSINAINHVDSIR